MKQYWIFTFGCGHENAGKYVKIAGSFGEARAKMCEKYGTAWAFQYSEEEWANNPYALEKEMEVIE